jgi:ribonuclease HI
MTVRVYTDGACSANGFGGYAAILVVDGVIIDGIYGGEKDVTNNKMELKAMIAGLSLLPLIQKYRCKNCGVVDFNHNEQPECEALGTIMRPVYPEAIIVSDSEYCVKGASLWMQNWKENGWKTKQKQPVKNKEYWEEIDKLTKLTGADFEWVKGHNGHALNELADTWAVAGKTQMYGHASTGFTAAIPTISSFP